MRTSLAAQRSTTQRLLASSGLPLMTDDEEATYASLKQVSPPPQQKKTHKLGTGHERSDEFVCLLLFMVQVIDEWTDQLRPMAGTFFWVCSSSLDL